MEKIYTSLSYHTIKQIVQPNWNGSGFNFTIMNPFVFGGNEALPMCSDSSSESYSSVPETFSFDVEY